jgi:DNA modification methylase
MPEVRLLLGDCRDVLLSLDSQSIDAVITDPPYPEIDRAYGRLTEEEWWDLMMAVVVQVRRVLSPTGSAVFILQPNSKHVGSMRPWLWRFMLWVCEHWNMVQDVWWWNPAAFPMVHCHRDMGLMRPSVKACVWCGASSCWREQAAVLWAQAKSSRARSRDDWTLRYNPSGAHNRVGRALATADARGGVTPFNLLPVPNTDSTHSAGANGHGAGTPQELCRWWVRYLCPPGGVVLDPFQGTGTVGMAAVREGCGYVGIEKVFDYHTIAQKRLLHVDQPLPFGVGGG